MVHRAVAQGPGHSVVGAEVGLPLPGGLKSVNGAYERLGYMTAYDDLERPLGLALVTVRWPNAHGGARPKWIDQS